MGKYSPIVELFAKFSNTSLAHSHQRESWCCRHVCFLWTNHWTQFSWAYCSQVSSSYYYWTTWTCLHYATTLSRSHIESLICQCKMIITIIKKNGDPVTIRTTVQLTCTLGQALHDKILDFTILVDCSQVNFTSTFTGWNLNFGAPTADLLPPVPIPVPSSLSS